VVIAQRLFLRHLSHVISVKIARQLCLRLGVTIATAKFKSMFHPGSVISGY